MLRPRLSIGGCQVKGAPVANDAINQVGRICGRVDALTLAKQDMCCMSRMLIDAFACSCTEAGLHNCLVQHPSCGGHPAECVGHRDQPRRLSLLGQASSHHALILHAMSGGLHMGTLRWSALIAFAVNGSFKLVAMPPLAKYRRLNGLTSSGGHIAWQVLEYFFATWTLAVCV